jgi:Rha family phage regulatory protein
MNNLTIINQNGINVTDSREVSEKTGIRHDNILDKIEGYSKILDTALNFKVSDFFIESSYQDSTGKTNKSYLLTKQGCEMVANKMTGQKGVLFTAEYVQAFNKMEKFTKSNFSISEFKGQLTTLINDLFDEKLTDVKEYYKIKSQSKVDISTYIKKRLGILRADEEYEQVKARVFLLLGISKWEDLDIESYKSVLPVIDESIRIIKLDRHSQVSIFD